MLSIRCALSRKNLHSRCLLRQAGQADERPSQRGLETPVARPLRGRCDPLPQWMKGAHSFHRRSYARRLHVRQAVPFGVGVRNRSRGLFMTIRSRLGRGPHIRVTPVPRARSRRVNTSSRTGSYGRGASVSWGRQPSQRDGGAGDRHTTWSPKITSSKRDHMNPFSCLVGEDGESMGSRAGVAACGILTHGDQRRNSPKLEAKQTFRVGFEAPIGPYSLMPLRGRGNPSPLRNG